MKYVGNGRLSTRAGHTARYKMRNVARQYPPGFGCEVCGWSSPLHATWVDDSSRDEELFLISLRNKRKYIQNVNKDRENLKEFGHLNSGFVKTKSKFQEYIQSIIK